MKKFFLSLMCAGILSAATGCKAAPATIHVEAESAQLTGATVGTQRAGYTGTGYVTGFLNGSEKMTLTVHAPKAGIYDVHIRYSAPMIKGFDLAVNGAVRSGMFDPCGDAFADHDAGIVELNAGDNTVEIRYGWGHYDIDSLDFIPAKIGPLAKPPATPADPDATPETRALMSYLVKNYGSTSLSGQYNADDTDYVHTNAGKTPAIQGADFMDYSPSRVARGSDPKNITEDMIARAKAGQVVTMVWHWNAPADLVDKMDTDAKGNQVNHMWYKGFYTDATKFDLSKAIDDPNSADYKLLIRDMDAIAVQLKKLSDAHVPVLWRPLHEAEGGWFWWGAHGPEPFKKLWRLMYDRFTNVDHLHNLIWVYSSGTNPDWYPGDNYVDIVGVDEYPGDVTDPQTGVWQTLQKEYAGRKLLALTEFGGVPDVDHMKKLGVRWSYFVSWGGDLGPKKMSMDALKRIYNSDPVVNADALPHGIAIAGK